jgi:hypothetical protein
MTTKLDEMWAALKAHKPAPEYAEAWRVMCRERTTEAAWDAYVAAPAGSAAKAAARAAAWALKTVAEARWAAEAAARAAEADDYAQQAINAIKEVKP